MSLYPNFSFKTVHKSSFHKGKVAQLSTPNGILQTPAFILCATKGVIKNLTARDFAKENTQIILANTYHLMLNGGADLMKKQGGLAKVSGWNGPTLTDSGGFQVFSFGHGLIANEIKGKRNTNRPSMINKINENGVLFKSYIDGSTQLITPEKSIQTQQKIGADLILVFDECTPFNVDKEYTANSMRLSHRWEKRSLDYFVANNDYRQALYGIIQGGIHKDLRQESVDFVCSMPFFGTAIGGCLGSSKDQMYEICQYTMNLHDSWGLNRPVHLLGIGGFSDIIKGVEFGIDTFDCVHPTRIARHGCALVNNRVYKKFKDPQNSTHKENKEFISLKNSIFKEYDGPIDDECECYTCKNFTAGYINYLIKANENSFMSMLSIHNIHQMNKLMMEIRTAIKEDNIQNWSDLKKKWVDLE